MINKELYLPTYPVGLDDKEYHDMLSLMTAMGVTVVYLNGNSEIKNMHPGLNICRNNLAYDNNLVVSNEVKEKIFKILKENTNKDLWQQ